MEIEEPWMPNYPELYIKTPLIILKDKYINRLKTLYNSYETFTPVDIKSYLNNGLFSLSTNIKYLLSVLPGKCKIIRMPNKIYGEYLKFELENINKNKYTFYISNISDIKTQIIMTYNTSIRLEAIIETLDDFINYFLKIIYNNIEFINEELIKNAYNYCVEVKLRMAIYLLWISEPENKIYSDDYNKKNHIIVNKKIEYLEDTELNELLDILEEKNKKSLKEIEIENTNNELEKECELCLSELSLYPTIKMPCCNMTCHIKCISLWFENSKICPKCSRIEDKTGKNVYNIIKVISNEKKKKK